MHVFICSLIKISIFHFFKDVCIFEFVFFCLEFFVPFEIFFHSFGDVTIACEGMQILTYARRFWLLSSEGSLACHTYCNTRHPFIMVVFGDPWHSHLMAIIISGAITTCFNDLSVAAAIRTPNLPLAGRTF